MRTVLLTLAAVVLLGCAAWLADPPPGYCPEGTQRESGGMCVPLSAAAPRSPSTDAGSR